MHSLPQSISQQQRYPLLAQGEAPDVSLAIDEDGIDSLNDGGRPPVLSSVVQEIMSCSELTSSEASRFTAAGAAASGAVASVNGRDSVLVKQQSTPSLRGAWKLKYQDFTPVKPSGSWDKADTFPKLIDRANEWLRKNGEVQVKTCETITWMSRDQTDIGDSEQMVLTKSIADGTHTYYMRGLRLWLIPQLGHKSTQSLSYTDISPEDRDRIPDLVARANRKIAHKQLKGRILTVETVGVPIVKGHLQTNLTRWTENADHDSPSAFVLRIYRETSSKVANSHNTIVGVKDIVPLPTDYGYEGFEVLIDRTNTWLKDQTDVSILNMQSVLVQKDNGPHAEMGSACFYSMPGINNIEPIEFFRILRVAFIKHEGDLMVDIPIIYPFTYETFTPELVRQKDAAVGTSQSERLEKMRETFSKVVAFLRNSGADVICSETVMNPMQMYIDESVGGTTHEDEMRFLFTVRLFLTGQIGQLVDGGTQLIKRASLNQVDADLDLLQAAPEKNTGRSPLFLRHVVGRQFKYRWVVLALSVTTCMAIIVVVSVVYSNR